MTQNKLIEIIERLREYRSIEYKQSTDWNSIKEKVAKTALGMSNIKDGGVIIIGVSQNNGILIPEGVSDEHLKTYNQDDVQEFINQYAEPYAVVETSTIIKDGKCFIAIVVKEFENIPVICKKDSKLMEQGRVYSRSYRMPETCPVRTQSEMREILDLATVKGIRAFYERIQSVGIPISIDNANSDKILFDKQLILSDKPETSPNPIVEEIKSSAYWRVVIRPAKYDENRLKSAKQCFDIIDASKVSLRGWDYPHLDSREQNVWSEPRILVQNLSEKMDNNRKRKRRLGNEKKIHGRTDCVCAEAIRERDCGAGNL